MQATPISLELLRSMIRIRMVEEEIANRYPEQQMRCPVHLSIGQEAAAVGVCSALTKNDWAFSGHRNHAHYLAKGGDLKKMLAEIYGKAAGCCAGRGGSMHLTDPSAGFLAATPIVGSTVPIAVGAALTAQQEGMGRVVVIFLGDGAMEAGVIHESFNFAALKKLPVLFACENNLYSVYSPLNVRQPSNRSLVELAAGHGISTLAVNGNDVDEVHKTSSAAVEALRSGNGPIFMELSTYRWREHCGPGYDNDIGYRTQEEFLEWKKIDPIEISSYRLGPNAEIIDRKALKTEINLAFDAATSGPFPDSQSASIRIYAESPEPSSPKERSERELTFSEALREAQDICLSKYPESYLMGLGVPDPKGIFGTTLGLQEKFGADRIFDIPLAENAITGVAIGSAITGMRPILTHQRLDFALVSIDQIVNQAAKWHYMFDGLMSVPLVIRMIIGRGWGQGPQHSQSLHSWFAHVPGLKVVMPSTPYDAKGILISAIEDNNPVLFLEHRWLHSQKGYVPEGHYSLPLDKSFQITIGEDITLVSIGYGVCECRAACDELRFYDINAEVIDLRSVNPLDTTLVVKSVNKTRRLLVVDHASSVCGLSSEILAQISERSTESLLAKPVRLTFPDYPCPTSHALTQKYYVNAADIVKSSLSLFQREHEYRPIENNNSFSHDQPNPLYTGPF